MTGPTARENPRDAVIIGAGPAGIAAAIQLKRSGIEPLVIERARPGGLLRNAHFVENYPGFPKGIPGPVLVRTMLRQMEAVGVGIRPATVHSVGREDAGFRVEFEEGRAGGPVPIHARHVIVATGTRGVVPSDIPIPISLLGHYIYREIADVPRRLTAGSPHAAIIGGGDCAFDYALNLAGRGCRVTILHRGERPRALPLLVERLAHIDGAACRAGVAVSGIERRGRGLRLRLAGGGDATLEVAFLMLAVGREPEDGMLAPGLRVSLDAGKSIEGLYLAGDVRRGHMRQVGIAVGDGLVAAMEIARRRKGMK